MNDAVRARCCPSNRNGRRRAARRSMTVAVSVALLIAVALFAGRGAGKPAEPFVEDFNRPQDVIAYVVEAAQRGDLAAVETRLSTTDPVALTLARHIHDSRSELMGHV